MIYSYQPEYNQNFCHILHLSAQQMDKFTICFGPIELNNTIQTFLYDNKIEYIFDSGWWFIAFNDKKNAMKFKLIFDGNP